MTTTDPEIRSQCAFAYELALEVVLRATHRERAEDLAQDVVLLLLTRLERDPHAFPSAAALGTWVTATARGRLLNAFETEKAIESRRFTYAQIESEPRRVRETPSSYTNTRDIVGRTNAALAAMPERRRAVFLLSLHGDLTMKQIGARLGMAAETARKHSHAALRDLTAALSDHVASPVDDDEWKIRPGTERGAEAEDQHDD